MVGEICFTTKGRASAMRLDPSFDSCVYYDLSSHSAEGKQFSPFQNHKIKIPVPGNQRYRSRTVEAIWQGLKIIDGDTDFKAFGEKTASKRKFEPYRDTKFRYGSDEIGLVEARKQIYVPAYKFFFDHLIPQTVIENMVRLAQGGVTQYLYDVGENGDIENPDSSYAHAQLVVELLTKEWLTSRNQGASIEDLISAEGLNPDQHSQICEKTESLRGGSYLKQKAGDFAGTLHKAISEVIPDDEELAFEKFAEGVESYAQETGYSICGPDGTQEPKTLKREMGFGEGWHFQRTKRAVLRNLYILEDIE